MPLGVIGNIKQVFVVPLKILGREVAKAAVTAPVVVPAFNQCENPHACLGLGLEAVALDEFAIGAHR